MRTAIDSDIRFERMAKSCVLAWVRDGKGVTLRSDSMSKLADQILDIAPVTCDWGS